MITALEEASSQEFTDLNVALQDGNVALAAATYVTLSEGELQQYLSFLTTPTGQRLNSTHVGYEEEAKSICQSVFI